MAPSRSLSREVTGPIPEQSLQADTQAALNRIIRFSRHAVGGAGCWRASDDDSEGLAIEIAARDRHEHEAVGDHGPAIGSFSNCHVRKPTRKKSHDWPSATLGTVGARRQKRVFTPQRRDLKHEPRAAISLGSVATSLSLAYAGWSPARLEGISLLHEGFEAEPYPRHDFVPTAPGYWSGDVTSIVKAEQGVHPKAGRQMLRFVETAPASQSPAFNSASEIWRLVDLDVTRKQMSLQHDDVDLVLELTATFNGVAASPGRQPQCLIKAIATDASIPSARSLWLKPGLEGAQQSDPAGVYVLAEQQESLDADPGSWQRLTITLRAPARARWLMLYCVASDTSDATREADVRLEGQYIDEIRLSAHPLPSTP